MKSHNESVYKYEANNNHFKAFIDNYINQSKDHCDDSMILNNHVSFYQRNLFQFSGLAQNFELNQSGTCL